MCVQILNGLNQSAPDRCTQSNSLISSGGRVNGATNALHLYGRTLHGTVRAKDAAVTLLGFERGATRFAIVEIEACVLRHLLLRLRAADGTRNDRLVLDHGVDDIGVGRKESIAFCPASGLPTALAQHGRPPTEGNHNRHYPLAETDTPVN